MEAPLTASPSPPKLALCAAALVALALCAASRATAQPAPVDYGGRPFVTDPAPVLTFERRTEPRPGGIDYPFAEQTARGVCLFARFPEFSLRDRRIHVSGPWYADPAADLHFTRGITSIEAMPNFRLDGATNSVRDVPAEHKWQLMCDPLFWGYAARRADELAAADPDDPRIASLRAFGVDHTMVQDEAAFHEIGRAAWVGERAPTDAAFEGVLYPCIDIETTGGWEHQRDCFGWIYQGMAEAAAENGCAMVPITYGQWTFEVGAVWTSARQGGDGPPEYLLPEKDFLAGPDPTLSLVNELSGIVSMDGYLQAIWGREPFYKRNADGSLVLADGKPVPNDAMSTTLYGQEIRLEPGEAEHCLQDLYRQAVRMYLMYYRLAGEYPERSDQHKPFLDKVRIGAWTRVTNEGLQGIEQNDRPLPGWELETLMALYLMTADDIVVWSSDTNTPPGPLGGDYTKAWQYNAHGVFEYIVRAAHRYSALDPIHEGPFHWCWFRLPMINENKTEGDRYVEKPLAVGKLRTFEGKPWMELFAAWPALDDQPTTLTLWVERDGVRSPDYAIELADGRSYFLDAWQLPAELAGAEGRDVHLRFTDQLGVERTWSGDWRENDGGA
jgi:hypothetical protein